MSRLLEPNKFLISIEDLEAKYKGVYHPYIDANLPEVIIMIMRGCAEFNIPEDFRDRSLSRVEIDSYLAAWLKEKFQLDKELNLRKELINLIHDAQSLFASYDQFKDKICRIYPTHHTGNVLIEVVDSINDFIIKHYRREIVRLLAKEHLNPIQMEMCYVSISQTHSD